MHADEPLPEELPPFSAEAGKSGSFNLTFCNPLGREINLSSMCSNTHNFTITPERCSIAAYGSENLAIQYEPSSVGEKETGTVSLVSEASGTWEYQCIGKVSSGQSFNLMPKCTNLVLPCACRCSAYSAPE